MIFLKIYKRGVEQKSLENAGIGKELTVPTNQVWHKADQKVTK